MDYTTFSPKIMVMLGRVVGLVVGKSVRLEGISRPAEGDAGDDEAMREDLLAEVGSDVHLEQLTEYRVYRS